MLRLLQVLLNIVNRLLFFNAGKVVIEEAIQSEPALKDCSQCNMKGEACFIVLEDGRS